MLGGQPQYFVGCALQGAHASMLPQIERNVLSFHGRRGGKGIMANTATRLCSPQISATLFRPPAA
jgi:hypothetical protein